MSLKRIQDVLRGTELFAPLPDDLLRLLSEESEPITVPAGVEVMRKGDQGEALYVISSGEVKVHDENQTVAEFREGEIVGELALLDQEPRSMSVTTVTDTEFLRISRSSFYRLLKDRPDVLEKLIAIITKRLRRQTRKLVEHLLHRENELSQLVTERTRDLYDRNLELKETLDKLRNTQQQLILSEKLASLVQLTAGIAHEIQNPLNFVINFSSLTYDLLQDLKSETDPAEREQIFEELQLNIRKIQQHGQRADATIKSMLLHSRAGSGEKQLTDISELISEMIRLSHQGFRTVYPTFHCQLDFKKDDSLPKINIVVQEFNRVLLNLFNNAYFSMYQKKMAMERNGIFNYEPKMVVKVQLHGSEIDIHVLDNGEGIPGPIQDKIFNPFFTTKPPGMGTGLGLSLSYDIITKLHHGKLVLRSNEGEGSEFVVSIPL